MCLAKSASARPILALQLLQQPPTPGPPPCGGASSASADGSNCCDVSVSAASASPVSTGDGLWVATADLAGTATVLLDQPTVATAAEGPPGASDAVGMGSSPPGPACCWRWQPYGSGQGPMHVGIWWATGSSHASGARGHGEDLGCRVCFTASGEGHVTAWQLPPAPFGSDPSAAHQQCLAHREDQQQQQHQQPRADELLGAGQQPFRLAETLLPFGSPATCLAAALLPLQLADGWRAALVAAGDAQGGVAALLLLLPPAVLADPGPAAAAAGKRPAGRLLVLAAARRVHELTPVRTIQVAVPTGAAAERTKGGANAGAQLARQLAEAEVLTAGGDNIVRTLRLPAAGILAAVSAALAPAPAEPPVAAAANGPAPGIDDAPGACVAPPPRLLATRQRHCEAVTHIDGLVRSPGGGGGQGGGLLVFGHFSTHFSVWDDAAEAEVARVRCCVLVMLAQPVSPVSHLH